MGPNDPSVTRESPGLQTELVNKKLEIMQQISPNKVVPLSQASLLSEEHKDSEISKLLEIRGQLSQVQNRTYMVSKIQQETSPM